MKDTMNYEEFLEAAMRYRYRYPEQRVGQAFFNALVKPHTGLAEQIYGTLMDPYYDNRNLPAFLQKVMEELC